MKNYDIVITHRNAILDLKSIDKDLEKSNIFKVDFRRVVLDELHEIT